MHGFTREVTANRRGRARAIMGTCWMPLTWAVMLGVLALMVAILSACGGAGRAGAPGSAAARGWLVTPTPNQGAPSHEHDNELRSVSSDGAIGRWRSCDAKATRHHADLLGPGALGRRPPGRIHRRRLSPPQRHQPHPRRVPARTTSIRNPRGRSSIGVGGAGRTGRACGRRGRGRVSDRGHHLRLDPGRRVGRGAHDPAGISVIARARHRRNIVSVYTRDRAVWSA